MIRTLATSAAGDVLLATKSTAHGGERTFVLRIVGVEYARDERFAKAFVREASRYGRLVHPNVVQLHGLLDVEDRPVVVLEHVEGAALDDVRRRLAEVGHELDDTVAYHVAAAVFTALAAAHGAKDDGGGSAPVLHRYLRPSKILVGADGSVKVRDFGLPEPRDGAQAHEIEIARGADGYMAPEQVNGKELTPRSDVYAAAVIFWELLTGKRAFPKTTRQSDMWRSMAMPRIEPLEASRPELDRRVRDLVAKALEPRIEKRAVTAKEIAATLRELVSEDRGREHLAMRMEMIRGAAPSRSFETKTPVTTPRGPARRLDVRGSMPTVDVSSPTRALPAPGAPAQIGGAYAMASRAKGAAAEALPDVQIPQPARLSSGKIPIVRPVKTRSSATMRAVTPAKSIGRIATPAKPITSRTIPVAPKAPPPLPARALKPPTPVAPIAPIATVTPRKPPSVRPEAEEPPPVTPKQGDPSSFVSLPKVLVVDFAAVESTGANEPPSAPSSDPALDVHVSIADTEVIAPAGPPPQERETFVIPKRSPSGVLPLLAVLSDGAVVGAERLGDVHASIPEGIGAQMRSAIDRTPVPAAPPPTSEPAPPAPAAPPPVVEAPSSSPIPVGMGRLVTAAATTGRRIFVDERTLGQTPEPILVKCGAHAVRIGSAGRRLLVDVPCGGELEVSDR